MNATPTNAGPKPVWHGLIVSTPGTCGGKPRIDGTRIRVRDIYFWHELQGKSVDDIVAEYPHITHAGVYAALSYYWDHREEMQRMMIEEDRFVDEAMQPASSKNQPMPA